MGWDLHRTPATLSLEAIIRIEGIVNIESIMLATLCTLELFGKKITMIWRNFTMKTRIKLCYILLNSHDFAKFYAKLKIWWKWKPNSSSNIIFCKGVRVITSHTDTACITCQLLKNLGCNNCFVRVWHINNEKCFLTSALLALKQ